MAHKIKCSKHVSMLILINMPKNKFLFLFCLSVTSCSSQKAFQINELISNKEYKNDQVSINASLNLARSAYLRGCVDQMKESEQKVQFQKCLKKAEQFIKDDIITILDQD